MARNWGPVNRSMIVNAVGGLNLIAHRGVPFDNNFDTVCRMFAGDVDLLGLNFQRGFTEVFRLCIETVVIPSIKQNFREEGRPKWQPLATSTLLYRSTHGFGLGPILQRTREMKNFATSREMWVVRPFAAYFNSPAMMLASPYAIYHHRGTTGRPKPGLYTEINRRMDRSHEVDEFMKDLQSNIEEFRPKRDAESPPPGVFFTKSPLFNVPGISKRRMPARPFLVLQLDDELAIYQVFFEYLVKEVDKYWGDQPDYYGL